MLPNQRDDFSKRARRRDLSSTVARLLGNPRASCGRQKQPPPHTDNSRRKELVHPTDDVSLSRLLTPLRSSTHQYLRFSGRITMSSSFDPSLSISGTRPPLLSADAPSMADQLPSINFGFEDLRARMAQFSAKFDAFIERGRKQVLEERNQFHVNIAEYQGSYGPVRNINIFRLRN